MERARALSIFLLVSYLAMSIVGAFLTGPLPRVTAHHRRQRQSPRFLATYNSDNGTGSLLGEPGEDYTRDLKQGICIKRQCAPFSCTSYRDCVPPKEKNKLSVISHKCMYPVCLSPRISQTSVNFFCPGACPSSTGVGGLS